MNQIESNSGQIDSINTFFDELRLIDKFITYDDSNLNKELVA